MVKVTGGGRGMRRRRAPPLSARAAGCRSRTIAASSAVLYLSFMLRVGELAASTRRVAQA
jgi:hypothetical protein